MWLKNKILSHGQFGCIHKKMIFIKILQKMLKLNLILQFMNFDKLGIKIMKIFFALRGKILKKVKLGSIRKIIKNS